MAVFNKFQNFVQDLGRGVHNLNSNTLKIMLTNSAPNAATHTVKADLTDIAAGNGYTAGGASLSGVGYSQSSGTGKLTGTDPVITAAGGTIGAFRYAVLYNDTPTSPADPLIGYWDYGSSITLADGESLTVDLDGTNGILQVA
jgi:hypothetical protein